LPGSPSELRELGNEAVKAGQDKKAAQLYTMAIDVLAKNMPRDKDGVAAPADLRELNNSSGGELAKLLSNRSAVYLRQQDVEAAVEDAEACTHADPSFEKGHLRLLAALDAAGASHARRSAACRVALEACPDSQFIRTRSDRLQKESVQEEEHVKTSCGEASIELTQRLADDPTDARHVMAAADYGAALAAGAHGVTKDVDNAEKYLKIGAAGGDVMAQRNLGWLLLELNRPAEAAQHFRDAARAGDEEAAGVLKQLLEESEQQAQLARAKLEMMAAGGDGRALEMLKELSVGA